MIDFSRYPNISAKLAEKGTLGKIKQTAFNKKAYASAEQSWNVLLPEEIMKIEYEMPYAYSMSNSFTTPTAICVLKTHTLTAVPVRDVVWIYGHVLKQSYNFIPTSKVHTIYVVDRYGRQFMAGQITTGGFSKKDPISEAMSTIQSILYPVRKGIVYGYTDQIADIFNNNLAYGVQMVDANSAQPQ